VVIRFINVPIVSMVTMLPRLRMILWLLGLPLLRMLPPLLWLVRLPVCMVTLVTNIASIPLAIIVTCYHGYLLYQLCWCSCGYYEYLC
jgi:hypothetical protein